MACKVKAIKISLDTFKTILKTVESPYTILSDKLFATLTTGEEWWVLLYDYRDRRYLNWTIVDLDHILRWFEPPKNSAGFQDLVSL